MSDLVEIRPPQGNLASHPSDLPAVPGGWTETNYQIDDRTLRLTLPALPDAFLDDPEVQAAHDKSEYMPYWAYLWPSAVHMARLVYRAEWQAGREVLELGAGIGLVGLAALARGDSVTFSDYEPQAVQLALHNAALNGLSQRAEG
ncbi:MAG: methyltransferase, partial [Planctomycetaceae bacterium]